MKTVIGSCPKCGAPIYAPSMWHGITPPPSEYSCNCYLSNNIITTSNSTDSIFNSNESIQFINSKE